MLQVSLSRQSPPPSPKMASPSSLSPAIVSRRGTKTLSEKALDPSFADLPIDVLGVIMSRLILKDNIHASATCTSWCKAAVSVRVVEKYPWLMFFPKGDNSVELLDPLQGKLYILNLPELPKSTVCYSRDGWLLMEKAKSKDMFFFNPYSRELITLPECWYAFDEFAFSCPPTSDNCVVVGIRFLAEFVIISTCHPGATEWKTDTVPCYLRPFYNQSNIVYCKDRFYCFNARGTLFSFHPSSLTWSYTGADQIKCPYVYDREKYGWSEKGVSLVEKKGELFVLFTSSNEKPLVYKLISGKWEEMIPTALDSLNIFVSYYNSELRSNLPRMKNDVYFSRFSYKGQRCVTYSFDESRYNPDEQWQRWRELCPPQSLWIDAPPQKVLDLLMK
ncbi:PREDICTED: F-box protein At4g00893-like [Camelina sativa]|uniref:F-box protein At4g00893-like n=1 Tax=Camelina sativa TaxID=90675 RepID=A0ABM0TZ86_CAMSA|nr:PREDICTED: F-box protein At4g00893-like [Camelina sativa]